jgi:uncharacterized membrane protein
LVFGMHFSSPKKHRDENDDTLISFVFVFLLTAMAFTGSLLKVLEKLERTVVYWDREGFYYGIGIWERASSSHGF